MEISGREMRIGEGGLRVMRKSTLHRACGRDLETEGDLARRSVVSIGENRNLKRINKTYKHKIHKNTKINEVAVAGDAQSSVLSIR